MTFKRAAISEMVAHFRIGRLDVGGLLQLRIRGLGGDGSRQNAYREESQTERTTFAYHGWPRLFLPTLKISLFESTTVMLARSVKLM